jgi:hypothetical protein
MARAAALPSFRRGKKSTLRWIRPVLIVGMIRSYGVAVAVSHRGTGKNTMTPTTRWAAAQRRKRQVINQIVIDRALSDPRRAHASARTPARAHARGNTHATAK